MTTDIAEPIEQTRASTPPEPESGRQRARRLLAPGPVDSSAVMTVAWLVVAGSARHDELLAAQGQYAAFWHESSRARG